MRLIRSASRSRSRCYWLVWVFVETQSMKLQETNFRKDPRFYTWIILHKRGRDKGGTGWDTDKEDKRRRERERVREKREGVPLAGCG